MRVRFLSLAVLALVLAPAISRGAEAPSQPTALSVQGVWEVDAALPGAPLRSGHSAVYDPVRDRLLIFGGEAAVGNTCCYSRGELFSVSLGADPVWEELANTGPGPRTDQSMIYDPMRDRLILFGGSDQRWRNEQFIGTDFNDVWVMDLNGPPVWTLLTPAGTPPIPRLGHSAIYDPVGDRMLVFGGYSNNSRIYNSETWELSLSGTPTWTLLAPAGTPPWRAHHSGVYDSLHDRMIILGGSGGYQEEVWTLSLSGPLTWEKLRIIQPIEGAFSTIYDPRRYRLVVLRGGSDPVMALPLHNSPTFYRWEELVPEGGPVGVGGGNYSAYDPSRDQMVFYGHSTKVVSLVWGQLVGVGDAVPNQAMLSAPRPNPSQGSTEFRLDLAQRAAVRVTVSDLQGRRIATLEQRTLDAGTHNVRWEGRDADGTPVPAGMYYVLAESEGWRSMRRVVLTR